MKAIEYRLKRISRPVVDEPWMNKIYDKEYPLLKNHQFRRPARENLHYAHFTPHDFHTIPLMDQTRVLKLQKHLKAATDKRPKDVWVPPREIISSDDKQIDLAFDSQELMEERLELIRALGEVLGVYPVPEEAVVNMGKVPEKQHLKQVKDALTSVLPRYVRLGELSCQVTINNPDFELLESDQTSN